MNAVPRSSLAEALTASSRRLVPGRLLCTHAVFAFILLASALIRAAAVEAKGYEFDMFMFRDWTVVIQDQGFGRVFHQPDQDYIGYHYVLWLVGTVFSAIAGAGWQDDYLLLHVLKVPGLLADLAIVGLLYVVTRSFFQRHEDIVPQRLVRATRRLPGFGREAATDLGLLAAALYAFNPGVIYATSYWGQLDSLPALFMLAALAASISGRLSLAWALLALGFFLKPQAVVLFPLLLVVSVRQGGIRAVIRGGLASIAVLVAGYAYFVFIGEIDTVYSIYRGIFFDESTKVSTSAWNLWWTARFHNAAPQDALLSLGAIELRYAFVSQLLTAVSGLLFLVYTWRARSPSYVFVAAAFLAFSFFMLPMKIHERYLFPIFVLMAPLALANRGAFLLYAVLTLTFTANLLAVYQVIFSRFFRYDEIALVCSALNSAAYVIFAAVLVRETRVRAALTEFGPDGFSRNSAAPVADALR